MLVSSRVSLSGILGEDDYGMFGLGAEEEMKFEPFESLVMVQDEDGNPVAGAMVTLVYAANMEPVGRGTTDDMGAAKIKASVDTARKADLAYRVDHPNLETPEIVAGAVSTGEEPTGIQIKLKKPAGIPVAAIIGGLFVLGVVGYSVFKK